MIDDLHSLGDLFSEPNGPAYQKTETRTGPPLEYVAEKLRSCLCDLHGLHGHVEIDEVRNDVAPAFYHAAVAFLALHNMLALADPPSFIERLLAMSREEFDDWLDGIQRGGSVT
jgi:hypothetical protein